MTKNLARFGDMMAGRMKATASAAVPTVLELGTINGNLSLSVDSLGTPIPKGEYMVALPLKCSTYQTTSETHTHDGGGHAQTEGAGTHTHSGGAHSHCLPEEFRPLKSGDRVLVAWCGHEPVVINIVVSS